MVRYAKLIAMFAALILVPAAFGPVLSPAHAWTELTADKNAPVLTVNRGRSTAIEVETSFATIAVADPEIASVTATSNRSFFVRGKAPGWTTVLIYDGAGGVIDLIQVNVQLGLDALRADLNTLLPNENFEVLPVYDGV
ncbi:MAG: pilus assembly protein N-terminal domain-containing protein, partial [Pseudomonadota bacterium]